MLRSVCATPASSRSFRRITSWFLAGAVTAATATIAAAAPPPEPATTAHATTSSATTGFSPPNLQSKLDALVATGLIEGAAVSVATPSGTWTGHAGTIVGAAAPEHTAGRVGSVTKMLVATMVLQEVAAGRWTLDTTVADVLGQIPIDRHDITVRQMLNHTSGLPEFIGDWHAIKMCPIKQQFKDGSPAGDFPTPSQLHNYLTGSYTDTELLLAAGRYQWAFTPGEYQCYSNTNYVVLGMMLEHATGKSMADLMSERLFQPANMTHTTFKQQLTPPYLADAYRNKDHRWDNSNADFSAVSSSGAVTSTPADLNRFQAALADGTLLPKPMLRHMRTPVLTAKRSPVFPSYGLGTMTVLRPCKNGLPVAWVGHQGSTMGSSATTFTALGGSYQVSGIHSGHKVGATASESLTLAAEFAPILEQTYAPVLDAACKDQNSWNFLSDTAGGWAEPWLGQTSLGPARIH